jgi:hypothetical protein
MSLRNTNGLTRFGLLVLPLAGVLALVGLYSTLQLGYWPAATTEPSSPAATS